MVYMKQNIMAYKKIHIQICLSTQVLFFKEQNLTFLVNITGPSEARTLRHWN